MLSQSQRTTILELHAQGVKKREIARVLGISRLSVRKVLRSNSAQVPMLARSEIVNVDLRMFDELCGSGEALQ
jgi:DNA invertase Pin-like site-specific DNA recombinase